MARPLYAVVSSVAVPTPGASRAAVVVMKETLARVFYGMVGFTVSNTFICCKVDHGGLRWRRI